jgi:hypothetical protein
MFNEGAVQSDVTSNGSYFQTYSTVQNTAFTLTNLIHYNAASSGNFGSATVSNHVGFWAGNSITGATTNIGFRGELAAASGNWNLYMNGNASNFLSGSLGIGNGKSVPTATLDINGNVLVTGSLNVTGGEIFAGRIDTTAEGGQVSFGRALDNANGWYIDVYGNTSTPSLRFVDVSTSAVRMTISGSGAITMGQSLAVGPINPSAVAGRIDASNDVVAFSTSDKRLKENIQPIENALDKLDKIGGYTFDWNNQVEIHGYEGHDIGVIAQEIEEVLPEVVATRDNGYKAVKYEKLTAFLIQVVKELKADNEDLRNEINNLKNK